MVPNLKAAADAIQNANALLICAGSGMGADSGLPTFRGNEGFWKAYPALRHTGISFPQMANPRWFYQDPRKAWAFYGHRFQIYRDTPPHEGFQILRQWSEEMPHKAFVFTSNVDGHFQKSGFPQDHIYECHGSLQHFQCTERCQDIWPAPELNLTIDLDNFQALGQLPTCPDCGSIARPNILMFSDGSWLSHRTDEQADRLSDWLDSLSGKQLTIIEIGAGLAVPTVRYFSETTLRDQSNATLIRINPDDPQGPEGTISLPLGALDALKQIEEL